MIKSMSIPQRMRAVVTTGYGGLDKLEYHDDWPTPVPQTGEVLIEVGACGMNNTDVNTRIGWYDKSVREGTTAERGQRGFEFDDGRTGGWGGGGVTFPRIQGADVCGTVVALGNGVHSDLMGRRVLVDTWIRDWNDAENLDKCRYFGSEVDGGFAEYAVAPAKNVHPVESDLSDAELATFATSSITAENMLRRAKVTAGDTVLIPGASGGVGTALIQLSRRRGAVPVAMCGDDKAERVRGIGADAVIPRSPEDLAAALQSAVSDSRVDVVADVVGGPLWPQLIEALRRGGRYTCAGAIAGPMVELDLRTFYLNDLTFTGATIIPPGLFAELVGYIERGEIVPLLAGSWPLERLREAQAQFLKKEHVGNLVVVVRQ